MEGAGRLARFEAIAILGEGSYGCVRLMQSCGRMVAVNTLQQEQPTWQGVMDLREVRALMSLRRHPNVVQLLEVIRDERNRVHLVFEYVEGSLYNYLKRSGGEVTMWSRNTTQAHFRLYCFQKKP